MAGLIISKDQRVEYEYYGEGFSDVTTIHTASVTKSIISILLGIALGQGGIKSIDQKVLEFFPEYTVKRGEKTIQTITLKHLLTMTAPYKTRSEPYTKVYSSNDWTMASLDLLGGKGTIGDFRYSTVCLQILSGVLVRATGQSLLDFANTYLFTPLGIEAVQSTRVQTKEEHLAFMKSSSPAGWVAGPEGVNTAGWGLCLKTTDMLKIGSLYLNRGEWKGRQLLSSDWIQESTSKHSQWGHLEYGYLWWVLSDIGPHCYAALGDGGNVIFVHPEEHVVIAVSSTFMPRAKDRIELIRNTILPLLGI